MNGWKLALAAAALGVAVAWFATRATPTPEATPSVDITPSAKLPSKPAATRDPGAAPVHGSSEWFAQEYIGKTHSIDALHDARPDADPAWREKTHRELRGYFESLSKEERVKASAPRLVSVDCRDRSCRMELEAEDYGHAISFLSAYSEGRGVPSPPFACPVVRTAALNAGTAKTTFVVLQQCGS